MTSGGSLIHMVVRHLCEKNVEVGEFVVAVLHDSYSSHEELSECICIDEGIRP